VVEWAYDVGIHPAEQQVRYRQKMYVGADTLVHRVVTTTSKGSVLEDDFRSIALNSSLPDSIFQIAVSDSIPKEIYDYKPRFQIGDTLPDFTLPGSLGDSINFAKAVAGKRGRFSGSGASIEGAVVWSFHTSRRCTRSFTRRRSR